MRLIQQNKEVIKKIYDSIWTKTFLCILLLLAFYGIRECLYISNHTVTIFNIVFLGIFLVSLYQSFCNKKFYVFRFSFIFFSVFILNQFYDENVFFDRFKIRLQKFVCWIGFAIFIYIILVRFFGVIKELKKGKKLLRIGNRVSETKEVKISVVETVNNNKAERANSSDSVSEGSVENEVHKANDNEGLNKSNEIVTKKNESVGKKIIASRIFEIIVFLIILLIPLVFIIILFNQNVIDKFEGIKATDVINVGVSLAGLIFLSMFMWTVVVGILIRLIQIIFNIINKEKSQNSYLLNASAFILISFFLTKQYDISLDNIIDSLSQGNILLFPILLIILLPLFITLIQNLEDLIMKDNDLKKNTVKLLRDLVFGILEALLNFIRFTTADFLISIQEIVKKDLDEKIEPQGKEQTEEQTEGLGEKPNG